MTAEWRFPEWPEADGDPTVGVEKGRAQRRESFRLVIMLKAIFRDDQIETLLAEIAKIGDPAQGDAIGEFGILRLQYPLREDNAAPVDVHADDIVRVIARQCDRGAAETAAEQDGPMGDDLEALTILARGTGWSRAEDRLVGTVQVVPRLLLRWKGALCSLVARRSSPRCARSFHADKVASRRQLFNRVGRRARRLPDDISPMIMNTTLDTRRTTRTATNGCKRY